VDECKPLIAGCTLFALYGPVIAKHGSKTAKAGPGATGPAHSFPFHLSRCCLDPETAQSGTWQAT
jgi:hypothetical protein